MDKSHGSQFTRFLQSFPECTSEITQYQDFFLYIVAENDTKKNKTEDTVKEMDNSDLGATNLFPINPATRTTSHETSMVDIDGGALEGV